MDKQGLDLSAIAERVLLVDDDENVLGMLKRHITGFGLQADLAQDGQKAVQLLQSRQYGLVITDINMPKMDGMELLLHVRKHYLQTDVLAISGYHELYNFTDIVVAGATDFIQKPFKRDKLKAKLQRIFRERLLLAELAQSKEKEKTFFLHIVESLAISLDEKDEYTHGHSRRVTNLALQLAEHATEDDVVILSCCDYVECCMILARSVCPGQNIGQDGKTHNRRICSYQKAPGTGGPDFTTHEVG